MKGSYTVEAALICPWILFSIILVWYLGFYEHNQTACQAICREAVYVGLEAKRCGRDIEAAMQAVLEEQGKMLPGMQKLETDVSVTKKRVTAKMRVSMQFPFSIWQNTENSEAWTISKEASASAEHPVNVLRAFRRAERLQDMLSDDE